MCGIAGLIDHRGRWTREERIVTALTMADAVAHRGPDDDGVWSDNAQGVVLSHRRLSIIDLSPLGHQPMTSPGGRYVLTYNGELYNHADLRRDLESAGVRFRSHSDTEVVAAAIEHWGLRTALERSNGMFAFGVWDRERNELSLARDRLGEKPLYFAEHAGTFAFCSEIKSLVAARVIPLTIDRSAIALFLRHAYIPAPWSIYAGVRKLSPGSYLTVRPGDAAAEVRYWDPIEFFDEPARTVDPRVAADELEALLAESIRLRMVADVPVGAFLSGGIDSSAVVALMQQQTSTPVKTFTVGFAESAYDEADHARRVAVHLHTDHTQLDVSPAEARAVIPRLPNMYDEPFADPSALPTALVAELARSSVTVSLSGDGGDELFNGYDRYRRGGRFERFAWRVPPAARRTGASLLRHLPPAVLDRTLSHVMKRPSERARRFADIWTAAGPEAVYSSLIGYFQDPTTMLRDAVEPPTALTDAACWPRGRTFRDRMAAVDLVSYLPDDILVKLDRATMAVSLEGRVPLLDHRLVEWALALPIDLKVGANGAKQVLRDVLYRYVSRDLVDRPKMGFGAPIGDWIRGPLREWAAALLDDRRIDDDGYFDTREVSRLWREHLNGSRDWSYHLWIVLSFQAWRESIVGAAPQRKD